MTSSDLVILREQVQSLQTALTEKELQLAESLGSLERESATKAMLLEKADHLDKLLEQESSTKQTRDQLVLSLESECASLKLHALERQQEATQELEQEHARNRKLSSDLVAVETEMGLLKSRLQSQLKGIAELENEVDSKTRGMSEEKVGYLSQLRTAEESLRATERRLSDLQLSSETSSQEQQKQVIYLTQEVRKSESSLKEALASVSEIHKQLIASGNQVLSLQTTADAERALQEQLQVELEAERAQCAHLAERERELLGKRDARAAKLREAERTSASLAAAYMESSKKLHDLKEASNLNIAHNFNFNPNFQVKT